MADRLVRCFLEPNTPLFRFYREIDNHYHLARVAQGADDLVGFQAASLRLQAAHAAATLQGFSAVVDRQQLTNDLLGDLSAGLSYLTAGVDQLNDTALETLQAVENLSHEVRSGFQLLADHTLQVQKALREVAEILRRPYETKARELREEADRWLKIGMTRTGRDRQEDFNDAMRLLRIAVDNPVGMQDYSAWMDIGWLLWKHETKLAEAEEAFYRTTRLAEPNNPHYHLEGLRHLAYMHYLQGKHEEAYSTICKAAELSKDHDTFFDLARYAAVSGRRELAVRYVEQCIGVRPTTIVGMFAEQDLAAVQPALVDLSTKLINEARIRALAATTAWANSMAFASRIKKEASLEIDRPPSLAEQATQAAAEAKGADYLSALAIQSEALDATDYTYNVTDQVVKDCLRGIQLALHSAQEQATKARKEFEAASASAKAVKDRAQRAKPKYCWLVGGIFAAIVAIGELVQWVDTELKKEPMGFLFLVVIGLPIVFAIVLGVVGGIGWLIEWMVRLAVAASSYEKQATRLTAEYEARQLEIEKDIRERKQDQEKALSILDQVQSELSRWRQQRLQFGRKTT